VTRPATIGSLSPRRALVLGISLSAIAHGCGRDRAVSAAAACSPPGGEFASLSRMEIIRWAGDVSYEEADPSRAYVYGFAPTDPVRIEAAGNRAGRGCIIARLTSARAFPAMGIGVGRSYVWAESLGVGHRAVIIPEDSTISLTVLPLALHDHVPGGAPPPTVGALGGCVSLCGVGGKKWCRFPGDTTRSESIAIPRDLDRLRTTPGLPRP
jgi:hypothetical protein